MPSGQYVVVLFNSAVLEAMFLVVMVVYWGWLLLGGMGWNGLMHLLLYHCLDYGLELAMKSLVMSFRVPV